jgi:hypothetical protein
LVFDVSATGSSVATQFQGALHIPLANLVTGLNQIPSGSTTVVVSDNYIDSAMAMILLRMYGYNAWIAQTGTCGWAVPGYTVATGITGTTTTYVSPAPGYVALIPGY